MPLIHRDKNGVETPIEVENVLDDPDPAAAAQPPSAAANATIEQLRAELAREREARDRLAAQAAAATVKPPSFDDFPQAAELRRQVDALQNQAQLGAETLITTQASAFVQAEFAAARIMPTEAPALKDLYAMLARDDRAAPLAAGPSRVDALRASLAARPRHGRFTEQIGADALPEQVRLLGANPDNTDPNAPPSAQKVTELLARFPEGRRLLLNGHKVTAN